MTNVITAELERQVSDLIKPGETYWISGMDKAYEAAAIMLKVLQEMQRESSK